MFRMCSSHVIPAPRGGGVVIVISYLLGRDAVLAQDDLLERRIIGQSVLVTGAGGLIGSELCRQILGLGPKLLLLFDHGEFNLYSILSELEDSASRESLPTMVLPMLGSVRNQAQLLDIMKSWSVDTVYHAVAYKHVPMIEHNIAEGSSITSLARSIQGKWRCNAVWPTSC